MPVAVSASEAEEMRLAASSNASAALLPRNYETAKQALAALERVDECSTWAKKAAALASYARQAGDDALQNYATRIKARAIRRCGELLKLIPAKTHGGGTNQHGVGPSTHRASQRDRAAKAAGLSTDQKHTALRVASIPEADFDEAVDSDSPPTVAELAARGTAKRPPTIEVPDILGGRDPKEFERSVHIVGAIKHAVSKIEGVTPEAALRGCIKQELKDLKSNAESLTKWLQKLLSLME